MAMRCDAMAEDRHVGQFELEDRLKAQAGETLGGTTVKVDPGILQLRLDPCGHAAAVNRNRDGTQSSNIEGPVRLF